MDPHSIVDLVATSRIVVAVDSFIQLAVVAIKAILLSKKTVDDAVLKYRPLGGKKWKKTELKLVARSVYKVELPELSEDIEYYIEAELDGKGHVWPTTAPGLNHTVVVMP